MRMYLPPEYSLDCTPRNLLYPLNCYPTPVGVIGFPELLEWDNHAADDGALGG